MFQVLSPSTENWRKHLYSHYPVEIKQPPAMPEPPQKDGCCLWRSVLKSYRYLIWLSSKTFFHPCRCSVPCRPLRAAPPSFPSRHSSAASWGWNPPLQFLLGICCERGEAAEEMEEILSNLGAEHTGERGGPLDSPEC